MKIFFHILLFPKGSKFPKVYVLKVCSAGLNEIKIDIYIISILLSFNFSSDKKSRKLLHMENYDYVAKLE